MSDIRAQVEAVIDGMDDEMSEWAQTWHKENCRHWDDDGDETMADHLEWCDERPSAYDWLEDALDIQYVVSGKGEYLSARILVCFGGPNVWVNTGGYVEGSWWGEEYTRSFVDTLGLDDACSEMWESMRG